MTKHTYGLTPAFVSGLISYLCAVVFLFFNVQWAAVTLSLFVLACLVAPFFPACGFFLPVISRGRTGKNAVALTFDDGPDPVSTPHLLRLLAKHRVPATFFVTGKNASRHPGLIHEIISAGHLIGNHTYRHDNFIMLKNSRLLKKEIESTRQILSKFGIVSRVFRPPAGITNPRLGKILQEAGMVCVNFSRRAYDAGNRRVFKLSQRILKKVRANDIILLHDVPPKDERLFLYWLNEVELIISGIIEKRLEILPLYEIIGEPVMLNSESRCAICNPNRIKRGWKNPADRVI